MIRFKQYMEESLDSPVKYKEVKSGNRKRRTFEFAVEGSLYRVTIVNIYGVKINVFFGKITPEGESYGTEPVGAKVAKTVFSTVLKIINDFVKDKKPDTIEFVADNLADENTQRSRADFYQSILKRHLPKDYTISKVEAAFDKKRSPLWDKFAKYFRGTNVSKDKSLLGYTRFTLKLSDHLTL